MSNKPSGFKRTKKAEPDPPFEFPIDDEIFLFKPELGSKALEPIGRLEADGVQAMFQAIAALLVEREGEPEGTAFRRFVDLDLDAKTELPPVFELIFGLYGDASPGESEASSVSSDDDEASSTPTSDASINSTSKRLKSA